MDSCKYTKDVFGWYPNTNFGITKNPTTKWVYNGFDAYVIEPMTPAELKAWQSVADIVKSIGVENIDKILLKKELQKIIERL